MKKIFTLMMMAVMALGMTAKDYTGTLTVIVDGDGGSQDAVVSIEEGATAGTYTLSIKNFMLDNDGDPLPVGNIVLKDIPGTTVAGKTTITFNQNVLIENGDLEEVPMWLGPVLGEVPIVMVAQFNDSDINVDIDINLESLGQVIAVSFTNIEKQPGGDTYAPGDVNRDGNVNGADVTDLYTILLN